MAHRTRARVCLIGLDSVPPALLFHKFWPHLPHLRALACRGGAGILRSCDPPITVPAWAAMLTGHDPGTLGLYGFHDRVAHDYHARRLASSESFSVPPLWEILSDAGLRSYVLGVPHTYPPRPFNGRMVTGLLTPSDVGIAVHPADAAQDARARLGVHALDVEDFRHTQPVELAAQVTAATRGLFDLAGHWATQGDWSLLTLVDMGPDRLQHALWRYAFADHPRHVQNHPAQDALRDYYIALDGCIGTLLGALRPDDMVLVVSDHGACAMQGTVALNAWLIEHGFLVLRAAPAAAAPLHPDDVDWSRTRAWADGGYVGRIYVNQRGREPCGVVSPADVDEVLQAIAHGLRQTFPKPPRPHRFIRPRQVYGDLHGCPPDLWVYMAGLRWRTLAGAGGPVWGLSNDRGPDGANHDMDGVVVMGGPGSDALDSRHTIYDIAPTVLAHLQQPIPKTMRGTPVQAGARAEAS